MTVVQLTALNCEENGSRN